MQTIGHVVLAHGDPRFPARLLRRLAPVSKGLVVHYDRSSGTTARDELRRAVKDLDVRFAPQRICHWGGWSLVAATLDAVRLLLDEEAPDRVVLLSGTAYPLGADRLPRLLAATPEGEFLDALPMPRVGLYNGGLDRVQFFHPFEGNRGWARRASRTTQRVQRAVGHRRGLPGGAVPHVGSQWWCLSRSCLDDLLGSASFSPYVDFFRRTRIPDESFFQTWVANSRWAPAVRSDPIVYTRWEGGTRPVILGMADLPTLQASSAPYARKVDERSLPLLAALDAGAAD